ncbi:MAG: DASH family cryptochrome [Planctomycetaceae bacterium]|nr:DASH family cryptochrome [Planctomycetaceae bacterium]
MATQIVWFRSDLRVTDNATLSAACGEATAQGGDVVAVYVLDPRFLAETRCGFERMAGHRRQFLRECLLDLDDCLRARGAGLQILTGHAEDVLPPLAAGVPEATVWFQSAIAPEEVRIQRRVSRHLRDSGVRVSVSEPATLYAIDDLPFSVDELPEVFTQFRRQVEKRCDIRAPLAAPACIPCAAPPSDVERQLQQSAAGRSLTTDCAPDSRATMTFRGGESAGWERIKNWMWERDRLRVYKETRNGLLHEEDASRLAPWLAHGCLSPRSVFAEVERYEQQRVENDSTYWLVFELLWRDYFALIVHKHKGAVFRPSGLRGVTLPWSTDKRLFDAWRTGMTGYPLIDAGMRELAATGFLSNRARQNVGSFLTKNLGIDWRMGAEWFESRLIDYDPCSNYGNWNYTAGVGNDARGFRWFNTTKQAKDYDGRGEFVRYWLPELKDVPVDYVHEPWKMHAAEQRRSQCEIGVDYPAPVVNLFDSAKQNEELYQNATNGGRQPRRRRRR